MKQAILRTYVNIHRHAKILEIFCIIATLIVISYQSIQMNLNLDEMRKNYSLDVSKIIHEHKQRINNILIDNDNRDLLEVFKLDKEKVMFYILINDYSNLYHMKRQGMVKKESWEIAQHMMVQQITHNQSLYEFWDENEKYLDKEFYEFLNPKIMFNSTQRANYQLISNKADTPGEVVN